MQEGLLWFDNDPKRSLKEKIRRAASRYQDKFSQKPTICYINAADIDPDLEKVSNIRLHSARNVLRHHLWIGVEDKTIN